MKDEEFLNQTLEEKVLQGRHAEFRKYSDEMDTCLCSIDG